MDVLARLARDGGHVVTKDDLLASVWQHRFVDESALSRTVSELRHALDDNAATATYIETVAKRGYRLVAAIAPAIEPGSLRVAVLPFGTDGHTADEGSFADGITDALITEFGRLHQVRILSHQTTEHLRGTQQPLPDIARELRVDAVVEGRVLRAGDRVRVTALLLQPEPEQQLWADSFDEPLVDVLALQARLARTIAEAVGDALRRQGPLPPAVPNGD